ncbi:unnamed protein product [Onchocerca flexuosa]|uniref:Uncharacterized protein n=1 Tax=Onchocerca flexuosa TaxID=387005 RepID=A0A183HJT7_9BILA|nr:unnamed protein product [Onchocerca flexuosa]
MSIRLFAPFLSSLVARHEFKVGRIVGDGGGGHECHRNAGEDRDG